MFKRVSRICVCCPSTAPSLPVHCPPGEDLGEGSNIVFGTASADDKIRKGVLCLNERAQSQACLATFQFSRALNPSFGHNRVKTIGSCKN
jgi:hypothetical protein